MHMKYAFFTAYVSVPHMSCGSWVTICAMHFGTPHILFSMAINYVAYFLIVGQEYGTTEKVFAIPALSTVSTI